MSNMNVPFQFEDHETVSTKTMSSPYSSLMFGTTSGTTEEDLNNFENVNYDSLPSTSLFYTESTTLYDSVHKGLDFITSLTQRSTLPGTSSLWTSSPDALSSGPLSSRLYGTSSGSPSPLSQIYSSLYGSSSPSLKSSLTMSTSTTLSHQMSTTVSSQLLEMTTFNDQQNISMNASAIEDQMDHNIYILPLYQQILWSVIFGTMVFVAAGGNLIVMWIVLTNKRMRTVTNYFLVNLSIADIILATLNVIFNFIYMLNADWPFGELFCKVSNFIAILSVAASVFTLMAISIDRYLAIVHPLRPRMSRTTTVNIIIVIWIAASLLSLPNIICSKTDVERFANGDKREWYDGISPDSRIEYIYNVIIMLVTYVLPMTSMSYTYSRVGRELWGSQSIGECTAKQMESIKTKRKIVKMMMIVVGIFGVCWAPYHIWFLLAHHYPQLINSKYVQHTYLTIYWLAMSNSVYNPFVYCWLNSRFRQGFRNVLCCSCLRVQSKPNRFHEHSRYHGAARYSCASETFITDTRVRFNGNGNITLQPAIPNTAIPFQHHHHHHHHHHNNNDPMVKNDANISFGTLMTNTNLTTTTTTTTTTNSQNNNQTSTTIKPIQSKIPFTTREML